jgi:lantibiotic modifying enzyme
MLPETLQGKEEARFLEAIATLISRAQEQLHTGVQALLLLITGLAGIGYGLLRLAAPTHVPSVIVLEAPKIA